MSNDTLTPRGVVTIEIYNQDSRFLRLLNRTRFFKNKFKGELIDKYVGPNLITTIGKNNMTQLISAGVADKQIALVQCGSNATATDIADTAITTPATVGLDSTSYPTLSSVRFGWTFGTGDANGMTVVEFGLICADGGLFSRITRPPIAKTAAISIVGAWEIDFT